uniref:Retrovirus-related Pol polyprotein from transposon TNT 1-94-like beta-barrel domain-containing protein n=1 Tax=Fagus sylvatica TaxID=28930 RepID=A0A2N9H5Z4_FAGSY
MNGPKYCKNCHKQGYLLSKCSTIQCQYCHKIGHIVYNCPTKPPKPGQSDILPRPVNHSVTTAAKESPFNPSLLFVPISELGPLVFTMVKQFLSTSDKVSSAVSVNTWYFDSACCNHMSLDSQRFSFVIPTTHASLIQTANGSHIAASHTGSVSTPTLSLSDTYLIPNLTLNLISVDQLCELGFDLWFGSSGCRVQDPWTNQVLGIGRRVGRMFELISLHLPSTPTAPPSHVTHTASVFPLSLWHLRLGTSQQNGRAECKHRHILDYVRAFLISASCPECFLGEAALTTVYTINYLPSSPLQNVTPFKCLYAHPSTVDHVLDQTPDLPPVAPIAPPPVVDPLLDQTPDLPLATSLADSPISPQEPASPVDLVTDQTPPLLFRRSDRVRAPYALLRDYSYFSAVLSLYEPHTYHEACTNPLWQQAMIEELQALEKTHTWDLVDLPRGKSAIGCK